MASGNPWHSDLCLSLLKPLFSAVVVLMDNLSQGVRETVVLLLYVAVIPPAIYCKLLEANDAVLFFLEPSGP